MDCAKRVHFVGLQRQPQQVSAPANTTGEQPTGRSTAVSSLLRQTHTGQNYSRKNRATRDRIAEQPNKHRPIKCIRLMLCPMKTMHQNTLVILTNQNRYGSTWPTEWFCSAVELHYPVVVFDCCLHRINQQGRCRRSSQLSSATEGMWLFFGLCLLYTSPSPRDQRGSRMPSSA